mgnify:CR=1 FL=1
MSSPIFECTTLEVAVSGAVARVARNRPDSRNACDEIRIGERTQVGRVLEAGGRGRGGSDEGRGRRGGGGGDVDGGRRGRGARKGGWGMAGSGGEGGQRDGRPAAGKGR